MSAPQFTAGPWSVVPYGDDRNTNLVVHSDPQNRVCFMATPSEAAKGAQIAANALLIAAAPDHADIGWAMCVAAGRWEPWGDGRGEFVLNGIRFVTRLDAFGVPRLTPALRAQIAKSRGGQ